MMMMQVVVVVLVVVAYHHHNHHHLHQLVADNASNFALGPTGAQTEWDGQVMSG